MRLLERIVRVDHAFEAEDDIVGIEVARGFEPGRGLELDAVPEMKREGLCIRRLVPCLGETRHQIERTALEFDERVVDCVRAGVEVRAGGVLRRVEARRTAF